MTYDFDTLTDAAADALRDLEAHEAEGRRLAERGHDLARQAERLEDEIQRLADVAAESPSEDAEARVRAKRDEARHLADLRKGTERALMRHRTRTRELRARMQPIQMAMEDALRADTERKVGEMQAELAEWTESRLARLREVGGASLASAIAPYLPALTTTHPPRNLERWVEGPGGTRAPIDSEAGRRLLRQALEVLFGPDDQEAA